MRIAVLDEDKTQSALICATLGGAGHVCEAFSHSKELLAQLQAEGFEMLVFHWQLADGGGAEIMRLARSLLAPTLPVLFITGRAAEDDIVAGLAAGADDYIIKPLRRGELVTRVQALLRRAYPGYQASEQDRFGSYVFETRTAKLTIAGKPVEVTQKEFDLALLFFHHLGRPLSRATILEAIWPQEEQIASRTMDTHVSRVRSKLGLKPERGFRLATVYSYGYRLDQTADPGSES